MSALRNSHLRIIHTEQEKEHIEAESPAEAQARKAKHATWKFDLFSTVSSDPLADGFCLQIIVAYSHFCGSKDRTAYLSEIDLQVRTGGLQPRSIRAAKRKLEMLGYLTPVGRTSAGIVVYRLANPRQQMIADHRHIAAEKLKEADAFRREEERRRRRTRGSRCAPPESDVGGADVRPTGGADVHPNTVENTVDNISSGEESSLSGDAGGGVVVNGYRIPDGWPALRGEGDDR